MGVSKNRGKTPKMDDFFHGKPYWNGWFGDSAFPWYLSWKHIRIQSNDSAHHVAEKIWKREIAEFRPLSSTSVMQVTRHVAFVHVVMSQRKKSLVKKHFILLPLPAADRCFIPLTWYVFSISIYIYIMFIRLARGYTMAMTPRYLMNMSGIAMAKR